MVQARQNLTPGVHYYSRLLVWSRCEPSFIKKMGGKVWARGAARKYCLHQLKENDHLQILPPCIWVNIMCEDMILEL